MELKLETKTTQDKTPTYGTDKGSILMTTPPIDETYWTYRVKLFNDQAIIGFPKFFTIGIGFAQEEDWNTNLPYSCPAEQILDHIWHNHKYDQITREQALEAIRLIQAQANKDRAEF
jgi:hypothetical protein